MAEPPESCGPAGLWSSALPIPAAPQVLRPAPLHPAGHHKVRTSFSVPGRHVYQFIWLLFSLPNELKLMVTAPGHSVAVYILPSEEVEVDDDCTCRFGSQLLY